MPDGPGGFGQDSSCPALLRCRTQPMSGFRLRGYHPLRPTFPSMFCYPSIVSLLCGPTTPARRCHRPGLGSCAFARRYWRNHVCFLFLRVLRCFSSPGWRPAWRDGTRSVPGCPIRTSAGLRVFAPLRGFSQLVTSFFASESQGILHAPFSPFLFSFFGKVAFLFASP